ncbi:Alpha/Beta hydrolase protein [Podospora aff. communis PSN243]|uniref:Alpha/Beta hydrolase protein n=1 Tax=Podospora aff. communis PSN243 TaxID=3040156 RepID=A0AAV9GU65_9PEZI|nr:Alpha/Beta hydrolase protein [Podospora aff. communis PSN243]
MSGLSSPFRLAILGAVLATAVSLFPRSNSPSHCSFVDFQISATAQNLVFSNPPDPNSADEAVAFMMTALATGVPSTGSQEVGGSFNIHAVYCKPTKKVKKHADTLQLLVHGITYNSSMWEGWGFGDKYNWHAYASKEGYHTLAIDRLGHGLSTRNADPLNVVQGPMHVEIIHQLISIVRGNTTANLLGRGFSKVAYVGHSFGSAIGTQVLRVYPEDVDAAVLTGFSNFINFPWVNQNFRWKSAAIHDPTRFSGIPYGYLTFPDEPLRTAIMYGGSFDRAISAFDFAHTDVCTIGEVGSNPWLLQASSGHSTPVMTVTGPSDVVFCPPGKPACEAALADTQKVFPDSSHYEYYVPDDTGHDLTLHYSAPKTFKEVHKFLAKWL